MLGFAVKRYHCVGADASCFVSYCEQVDLEIARQREVKMGTSSKDEAQDKGLTLLRLKYVFRGCIVCSFPCSEFKDA